MTSAANDAARALLYATIAVGAIHLADRIYRQNLADMYARQAGKNRYTEREKLDWIDRAIAMDRLRSDLHETRGKIEMRRATNASSYGTYIFRSSVDSFETAVRMNPAYYNHHLRLAGARFKFSGDAKALATDFERVGRLDPFNPVVWRHRRSFSSTATR